MDARYLRNLLTDEVEIENLILAKAALAALDAGYQDLGVETPEWITDKLSVVSKEVVDRNRAELQKMLKTATARREALATVDEKRSKLDAEIAALQQKLA